MLELVTLQKRKHALFVKVLGHIGVEIQEGDHRGELHGILNILTLAL